MRVNKITGIYAIEVPSIRRAYIGQSVDITNRIAQHKAVFKNGKAKNKDFQVVWNKYKSEIVFKTVVQCSRGDLLCNEYEACKSYLREGWTLFNSVISTETNILNAPKEYIPALKKVIKVMETGEITPDQLIRQLDNLQNT